VASRFVPYIVVGVLHLLSVLLSGVLPGAELLVAITKPLLMPVLLVCLLWALPARRGEVAVLGSLAVLFGWLGDVSLMNVGPGFVIGLGFFLLGHLAYVVLFWRRMRVRRPPWWVAVYLLWFAALLGVLAPHAGALLVPLAAYGLALVALGASGAACNSWIAVGSACFVASDSLLGLDRFLPGFALWQVDALIMLTYIVAQGLICFGIVRRMRAAVPAAAPAPLAPAVGG